MAKYYIYVPVYHPLTKLELQTLQCHRYTGCNVE